MAAIIPTNATAGQLAKIVGTTERVIAGRKSDGRLPVLPNGSIDLHSVIRAGAASLAQARNNPCATGDLVAGERFDSAIRAAARVTAHIIVHRIVEAGPAADLGTVAAEALSETLNMMGIDIGNVPRAARIEPLSRVA
jgi:hypothetical protein